MRLKYQMLITATKGSLFAISLLLAGCSTESMHAPVPAPVPAPAPPPDEQIETDIKLITAPKQPLEDGIAKPPTSSYENVIIRTFYATNRNATGSLQAYDAYGREEGPLSYGVADISIPRDHRLGRMEAPFLGLKALESPRNDLMLLGIQAVTRDQLLAAIHEKIRESKGKSALVFIHGYTASFEDAARRTAQMSYDLGFDGAPIFYSWPSQEAMPAYRDDEKIIERATPKIKKFLSDIFQETDAQNIYLVAHSMGNRGMAVAISELLNEKPAIRLRLKQLILTAPDIGVDEFKGISTALVNAGAPVTLYASSKDKALLASKLVNTAQRIGDTNQVVTVVKGIETIDASDVSTDFLGHSYFAENGSVVSDMFYLFRTDLRPEHRFNMKTISSAEGAYWKFKPGLCEP
ncbi:esterase/lipase superfamily enzyme [Pseudomonas sp. BS3782 TE3695]|uniref:alpha/beta hydrolase n=1 Tax=Pseudomonas sp. BS3782 TE3695 TaxID=3349323 RepID=UPI003D1B38CC